MQINHCYWCEGQQKPNMTRNWQHIIPWKWIYMTANVRLDAWGSHVWWVACMMPHLRGWHLTRWRNQGHREVSIDMIRVRDCYMSWLIEGWLSLVSMHNVRNNTFKRDKWSMKSLILIIIIWLCASARDSCFIVVISARQAFMKCKKKKKKRFEVEVR